MLPAIVLDKEACGVESLGLRRHAGRHVRGRVVGGLPEGVGVRTYSDGRVEAGRWRRGRLEEPLELW